MNADRMIARHWNATRTMLHKRHDRPVRYARAAGHIRRVVELSGRPATEVMREMQLDLVTRRMIERELRKTK